MDRNLDIIWNEFSIPLKAFINKHIDNNQDAEDILQNVFLKIHNSIDSLNELDKIHNWIFTIARNSIFDFYRSNKHDLYIESMSEDIFIDEKEEKSLNNGMAQCLKNMIGYLPENYKQALIMTEFENITQKELALRMGISVSGAKSRVQRARTRLKDMILNCCYIEQDHRGNIIDYKIKNKECDC